MVQLSKFDESCQSFQLFNDSIKSDKTKITYKEGLNNFMRFHGLTDYMDLKNADTDTIQNWLETWVVAQKKKGLKHFTIAGRVHGVEAFLDMNKKIWFRKVVHKLIPSNDHIPGGDVPFDTDEVYRMLNVCQKPRDSALLHFIASTGIRPYGFEDPVLRMKHLEEIEDCYAIKIYDGSKEGYYVFLTPEARMSLDIYFSSRKRNGEIISGESPIFANYTNERTRKNEYISALNVRNVLLKLFHSAGIERTKQGHRFDKSIVYGFRKRFNGILKMNDFVNSNIAEKLMAHKNGLDGNYLKPTMRQCFAEFKKAIPELTINPTRRLEEENKRLKSNDNKLDTMKDKYNTIVRILTGMTEDSGDNEKDEKVERDFDNMLKSLKYIR